MTMKMNNKYIQEQLTQLNPCDKARWLEETDYTARAQIIQFMTKDELADVFRLLSQKTRESLLEALSDPDIAKLIQLQESDDLVDVLQEMPANLVIELLDYVSPEKRAVINQLLHYPDESVGSLMSVDFVTGRPTNSKTELLNNISNSSGGPEHLNQIIIIDEKRHLLGHIYLSDLIKSQKESIQQLIHYSATSVTTGDDQEIASGLFMTYQLLSLPVVDSENRLVGIVTADDIFSVISDEIHEDYLLLSGVKEGEKTKKTYLERTVLSLSKDRIWWLLFLMISATLTGYIIQRYEAVLASSVVLAAYIPMLMDSGGNSGTQSSTLTTRSLSLNELQPSDFLNIIWKEFRIGLFTGSVLALVNLVRIFLMDDISIQVGLTVSITLIFVIVLAKVIGGILPMVAEFFNQDPAVMAGPLITTIVDTVSLLVYFQIATVLLGI